MNLGRLTAKRNFPRWVGWLRAIAILFALPIGQSFADGIPIAHGRYSGPAALLTLSPAQVAQVGTTGLLKLTVTQKNQLRAVSEEVPDTLTVLAGDEARASCTCHASNVGIWVTRIVVQVPHAFLRQGFEAEPELNSADRQPAFAVNVDADGRLFVDGEMVSLEAIEEQLRKRHPVVDHIIVRLPPRAADIALSEDFRRELHAWFGAMAETYRASYILFD